MLKLWNNQCGGEKKKEEDGAYAQKKKKTNQKNKNGMHKVMEPIHKRRRLWNSWPKKFKDPNKCISKTQVLYLGEGFIFNPLKKFDTST